MENDPEAVIEAAIRKAGSVYKLAERLQLSVQTIIDWRAGKQLPQADHLILMRRIVEGS